MSFKADLAFGQDAEVEFHKLYPWLIREDGRKYDFSTPTGKLVELKTEKRTTAETPNVALEISSSVGRVGCIRNSFGYGVHYLVFSYADGKHFVYDCTSVFIYLISNAYRYRSVLVSNGSYQTTVVLVPRADLKALEVRLED